MNEVTAFNSAESQPTNKEHHTSPLDIHSTSSRLPQSPSIDLPSLSEYSNTTNKISPSMTSTSPSTSKILKPGEASDTDKDPVLSRHKQLLAKRRVIRHVVGLSTRRRRLLEEAKEKARQSEYEATRLSSRLDILNLFVDHALVDDAFLGKRELNPWRFKNNPALARKYDFVNSMVTAQEMLVLVENVKDRIKEEKANEDETRKNEVQNSPAEAEHDHPTQENKNNSKPLTNKDNRDSKNTEQSCETTTALATEDNAVSTELSSGTCVQNQSNTLLANGTTCETIQNMKPKQLNRPQKAKVKLRKCKKLKPEPNSDYNPIFYAFGSSHNRKTCQYCGSLQCAGQLTRTRTVTTVGKHSSVIGERIMDFQRIYYDRQRWHSRYCKNNQERMKEIVKDIKDKLVDSKLSTVSKRSKDRCK